MKSLFPIDSDMNDQLSRGCVSAHESTLDAKALSDSKWLKTVLALDF